MCACERARACVCHDAKPTEKPSESLRNKKIESVFPPLFERGAVKLGPGLLACMGGMAHLAKKVDSLAKLARHSFLNLCGGVRARASSIISCSIVSNKYTRAARASARKRNGRSRARPRGDRATAPVCEYPWRQRTFSLAAASAWGGAAAAEEHVASSATPAAVAARRGDAPRDGRVGMAVGSEKGAPISPDSAVWRPVRSTMR